MEMFCLTNVAERKEPVLQGYFWAGKKCRQPLSSDREKWQMDGWVLKQIIPSNFDPLEALQKLQNRAFKKMEVQKEGEQREDSSKILLEAGKWDKQ